MSWELSLRRQTTTLVKEEDACMETNSMFLPDELIVQILQRLPVKCLIRFKCVCKSWFSLISHDPQFAKSHFEINPATHTRRIALISNSRLGTRSFNIEASLNDDSAVSVSPNLHFLSPLSYLDLRIKGSCRGFILLHCASSLYLWNPSTGVHKQIPLCSNLYKHFYGFGYDHSTDDYLVVSLCNDRIPNSDSVPSHLWLFSLRANAWKEFPSTTHLPFYRIASSFNPNPEFLFNDAIHWLAFRHGMDVYVIVAFHLTERKLIEIPLPVDVDYDSTRCGLWVFRGFLSLWVLSYDAIDIWVMEEYRVHSSWSKTLVLPVGPTDFIFPICCTKSGDIVVTNGSYGLVKYNNKGEFLERNSFGKDALVFLLAMYTESLLLLPVPGDNEQG